MSDSARKPENFNKHFSHMMHKQVALAACIDQLGANERLGRDTEEKMKQCIARSFDGRDKVTGRYLEMYPDLVIAEPRV